MNPSVLVDLPRREFLLVVTAEEVLELLFFGQEWEIRVLAII